MKGISITGRWVMTLIRDVMTLIRDVMTLIRDIMTLIKVVMTLIKSGHDTTLTPQCCAGAAAQHATP